jgi:hypothetical protein
MQTDKQFFVKIVIAALLLPLLGCVSQRQRANDKAEIDKHFDDVRNKFNAKRATLEQLLEMSKQDYAQNKVIRIAPDFTRLENNWAWPRPDNEWGISAARWSEYRKLFDSITLPFGIQRDGKDYSEVLFPFLGEGSIIASHDIGVVFSPNAPSDQHNKEQVLLYKKLSDNWYFYDWDRW